MSSAYPDRLLGDFLKVTPAFTLALNHVMFEALATGAFLVGERAERISLGCGVARYLSVLWIVAAVFILAALALVADLGLGGVVSRG